MYVNVDNNGDSSVEGFAYTNRNGDKEAVVIGQSSNRVMLKFKPGSVDENDMSEVYYEDIPNLIKALQAAYVYKQKEKQ